MDRLRAVTGAADPANSMHLMWMRSDGHRRNMLNSGYDAIGVGVACRGSITYASVLFLRFDYKALDQGLPPENPIVHTDRDPASPLHCS